MVLEGLVQVQQFRRWTVATFAVILIASAIVVVHLVATSIPTGFLTSAGPQQPVVANATTAPPTVKASPRTAPVKLLFQGPVGVLRPPAKPASITAPGTKEFGWSLLNLGSGALVGSANQNTLLITMESMVKPWIAADYLRRLGNQQPSKAVLNDLTLLIIDSNDTIAQKYYEAGGSDAVMHRMISMCHMQNTSFRPHWYSVTTTTPQMAAEYGKCLANGTAAGKKWTPWLLSTMQKVRGGVNDQEFPTASGGKWGIIDGLPAQLASQIAWKNGYTQDIDGWYVSCMAIDPGKWVLSVMLFTPNTNLQFSANVCAGVAKKMVVIG
jgi:hypothetical protein